MSLPLPPPGAALLVLPRLRIQNANAMTSPLTHGFPSMTAFLGLMWALNRRLAQAAVPLRLHRVGVICHDYQEQVEQGYVQTFRLTRNPVNEKGETAAIVEEGRIHLDLTLVFEASPDDPQARDHPLRLPDAEQHTALAWAVHEVMQQMRVAGGSIIPNPAALHVRPSLQPWPESAEAQADVFRRLRRQWLPGSTLVSRDDLLHARLARLRVDQPQASLLDAWLDLSRFNWRSQTTPAGQVRWSHDRPRGSGWVVPISVGYGALLPLQAAGEVARSRDSTTAVRFVEGLYSMGEWLSPHRLPRLDDLLWWGELQADGTCYRCCNGYQAPQPLPDDDDDDWDDDD